MREEILQRLARVAAGRVAVDGPDAAGKTTFGGELAARLGVEIVHADDHLLPDEVRARSAYLDSFDTASIAAAVRDRPRVVAEGVFLLRPELRDLWDLAVYLHVEPEETLRRALVRDLALFGSAEVVERRYRERYLPGQLAYRALARPREAADVVLDMTHPGRPEVLRWSPSA